MVGWFVFYFLSEEERLAVEECLWVIRKGSFGFFGWTLIRENKVGEETFLSNFPGFSLFCWNLKGFKAVVNSIESLFILNMNNYWVLN